MKIGMIGLGKMGGNMSARLIEKGHEVVGIDPSADSASEAVRRGVILAEDRQKMLELLPEQKIVWLMIPSQFVDDELTAWLDILPAGSVLVDGGNSRFEDSIKRGNTAAAKGVMFADVGTSGGIVGATAGYSMMVGGDKTAFELLEPILQALAQPEGYGHFGPTGTGHFVKMVHNAIEYGMMEALAEGYELMENGPFPPIDFAGLAAVWQHGAVVESFLNGLAVPIFSNNRNLDGIEGKVNMLGEAQWAAELAKDKQVDFRVIEASIARRADSMDGRTSFATKFLAAMRNQFGGHDINKTSADVSKDSLKNV
ncbi:MAG TPA: NADP-dependent phosphogluconate dehydrogenase [Candidatus Saccharimonadales bacterium]|nr:NADP-dependent phosphogluconate dehydrogenase [Candidatus Saccharimonadales bacterium]